MKIEIWADVICPFCGLGNHRLHTAISLFAHREHVELVHRSFQLDPSFPAGKTLPVREMLRIKYGMNDEQLRANWARIQAQASADGLVPFNLDNLTGNTRQAHELLAFAGENGLEAAAWARLYRAYFGEGKSIFGVEALVTLGVEMGLDAAAVREALATGRYATRVAADGDEARKLGARGVPFVLVDRETVVSGAQPLPVFQQALDQAWRAGVRPHP